MVHATYPEFADRVVERWRKASISMVGVSRLDPYNLDAPAQPMTLTEEHPVVELYSEREAFAFAQLNRRVIELGLIVKEGAQAAPDVDVTNAVSDDELRALLSLKPQAFTRKIEAFTSPIPLRRLRDLVDDATPIWIVKAIDKRLQSLTETNVTGDQTSSDSHQASSEP
jgi:hypothetical protein